MNAKGTTNATYQIGKRGGKIFGGVSTPTVADVSTGDVWLDKTNLKTKIALLVDSTSGFNFDSERFVSNSTLSFVDSLMYNSDGSKGYTAGGGTLQQYSLSTAYDWNTRTIDTNESTTSFLDGTGSGIEMSVDGKAVWVMKDNHIYGKTLTTAFDVTTMGSANQTYNFGSETGVGGTAAIKRNRTGDKLYISVTSGTQDNTIRQYTLADYNDTPNVYTDLSYASKNMSHASQFTSVCRHIEFNDDGTKMYLAAGGDSNIYIYTLSTAHDVSTASYSSTLDFTEASGIYTFTINPAGSKLWISDGSNLRLFNMTGGSQTVTWSEVLTTASVIAPVDMTVSNNLTVSGNLLSNDITSDSISIDGDATITGNLTVSGTTTTINTATLNIEDNILVLNSGFTGADNIVDAGFEVNRGDETNVTFTWDESEGEWTFGAETLVAGSFTGDLDGNVVGSIRPNGVPNNVTVSGNLVTTGANVIGLSTSSITEGSNQYYTDARARASVSGSSGVNYNSSTGAITADSAEIRGLFSSGGDIAYNSTSGFFSYTMPDLAVSDFALSAYNATNDVWDDNDSTFATTGRITDMIGTEIANASSIVHTTGTETIAGAKTFSTAIVGNLTGNVTGAVTGTVSSIANFDSDNLTEGSSNLFYTNPRARLAVSVTDASGQLAYNSSTGVISFTSAGGSVAGSTTQVQFNNSGSLGADAGFTFADDTVTVGETKSIAFSTFTNYDAIITTADYGSDLGSITSATDAQVDQGFLVEDNGLPVFPSYNVTTLPSSSPAGAMVFVPNETGGAVMCFFDGTNWRRMTDRAIAS